MRHCAIADVAHGVATACDTKLGSQIACVRLATVMFIERRQLAVASISIHVQCAHCARCFGVVFFLFVCFFTVQFFCVFFCSKAHGILKL